MFEAGMSSQGGGAARHVAATALDDARSIVGAAQVLTARLGAAAVAGTGIAQHADGAGEAAGAAGAGQAIPARDPGAELVDLLSAVSELVSAAEAVSARAAVELDRIRRAQEAASGVPAKRRGRGVAAEVGLARRESAHRGRSFLGLAKVLCTEMPHTMKQLAAGRLTPWRATLLAKESACLALEDRQRLDRDLCADPEVLEGLGDRAVGATASRWAAREDPASVVARRSKAEADRRVTIRPAPDTMVALSALLPVAQGVAAYTALSKRADAARAAGDERSRGQVMADALVSRVTGQEEGAAPGVLVNLVMTDTALFSGGTEPGWVPGYGPVPAETARDMIAGAGRSGENRRRRRSRSGDSGDVPGSHRSGDSGDVRGSHRGAGTDEAGDGRPRGRRSGVGAFVRRLYLAPKTGALVAMDARTREVPKGLADLIEARDGGSCRVPWCDAPARHDDHIIPVAAGGATSARDLQQVCEAHNYAKEALGWSAKPVGRREPAGPDEQLDEQTDDEQTDDEREATTHQVVTRTPSGHAYLSTAPPLPGAHDAAAPAARRPGGVSSMLTSMPLSVPRRRGMPVGAEGSPADPPPGESPAGESPPRESPSDEPQLDEPQLDPSPGEIHLAEILSRWRAA